MHEATPVLPAASVPRTQTLYTSVGWPGTVHFTFTVGDVLNAGVAAAPALTQVPPSRLYSAEAMFEFPVFESSTFALSSNEVFIITGLGLATTLDVTGPLGSQVTLLSVLVDAALPLPEPSAAAPAAIDATTVPAVVIPDTATLYVVPLPVTVAVVAPAEPLSVTSPVAKLLTVSLNTTVKLIGDVLVGSAWPAAWLIVTVGAAPSYVTVLSVLMDTVFPLPAASVALSAAIDAITVPSPVIPDTATLYVVPLPVTVAVVAPAVPLSVTSPVTKSVTASLNTTEKLTGETPVGSAWLDAWLIVTVGAVPSNVTLLSVLVDAVLPLPKPSAAAPAATDATTVPLPVIPVTATL